MTRAQWLEVRRRRSAANKLANRKARSFADGAKGPSGTRGPGSAWSTDRMIERTTQPDRLAEIRQAAIDSASAPDRPNLKKSRRAIDVATCVSCGCTDARACPSGCGWVTVDRTLGMGVCSSCVTR